MLSAIKEIGKLVTEKELSVKSEIKGIIFAIVLDADKSSYLGLEPEEFDSEKMNLYLFRQGASKGNAPSPFVPLNVKEPQKTYCKIERWLKQCNDMGDDLKRPFINNVFKIIREKRKDITLELSQKVKDFHRKKGEGRFLTLKINKKYLGEYDIFSKCLIHFADIKRKRSASSGVCSICGLPDKEVSGKTDVFKFYTVDKPGFITGGFDESLAWKNFPVCMECKTLLENGRKFIDTKLNFRFYGLSYYLIPRLLIGSQDVLNNILDIFSDTTKTLSLKERIKKRITNDENEILEYLSEEKDILTLNFLFLQRQQSAERILLLIEDVFPSRIRKIFEAKDYIDRLFNNDSDKGFTFGTIRTFFSKSDENKKASDLNKYFLEIVDSVFKGRRLDFSFLFKFYMAVIRKEFINEGYFTFRVKDALMNMAFFENLGQITFEEVEDMEESIFSSVFARYGKSFGNPVKRGIFLMGVLTQLLLNKQWSDRNAKPFMKKLKGLRMDEKDIRTLLPDVQNKLEEYDSFDKGKKLIAAEASKYLLEAGDGWKMPIDEINFYFACGMNLADNVTDIAYQKN
jgi:CRISPR-associated protein Csh1